MPGRVNLRHRHLDHKAAVAGKVQAQAQVVAQINEFSDGGVKAVGAAYRALTQHHPLRADGQRGRLAGLAHAHRAGRDTAAASQARLAEIAVHMFDGAGNGVALADKARDKAVYRRFVQRFRRVDLLDFALVEHRHAVRHGQRFGLVVGDVHHGDAQVFVNVLDFQLHMLAQLFIQRAQRFVHQHQLRLEHQRPRQRHALLLAAGHLAGVAVGEFIQLDHAQRALDLGVHFGGGQLADFQRVGQVFAYRHVREQGIVLEHHADIALVRRHAVKQLAIQTDFAGGGGFKTRQHHQAGGLARAGRPQQSEELATTDVEVEVFHDEVFAIVAFLHATKAHQHIGIRGGNGH